MTSIPHKGSFTVKLLLRSITLLEGSLTTVRHNISPISIHADLMPQLKEATTARTLIAPAAAAVPKRLKRRNPYAGSIQTRKNRGSTPHARIDAATDEELCNEDITVGESVELYDEDTEGQEFDVGDAGMEE